MVIKARLLGLLEESAKLRRDIQDVQGQFLHLLNSANSGANQPPTMAVSSYQTAAGTPVKRPRSGTATASPVLRALAGRLTRNQKVPRPGTPIKGSVATGRACRLMDKENVCHNTVAPEPLVCSPVCADKDRSIKDISQISHITRSSFREQPSTADLSGNFHSTFNYPLHSTLNYPLSSTINMEGPGEGLEVTVVDEDRTLTHTRSCQSSTVGRSSASSKHRRSQGSVRRSSRSARSSTPPSHRQQQRQRSGESEVDCDCDSSVLSDLVDDITLDQMHNESRSGTPTLTCDLGRQRGLRRQTGQALLTENLRPPMALSQSDFVELDSTLKPQFDMTQADVSMDATRGSLPDLSDLSIMTTTVVDHHRSHRAPFHPATRSHHHTSEHSCPPHSATSHRRDSRPVSRPPRGSRLPPCGQESDLDSGVSCSSRSGQHCTNSTASYRRTVSSDDSHHCQDRRALAKKLKRFGSSFNSTDNKPKLKIKTLGIF